MTTCCIDHPNFTIRLQLHVFESDIPYPSNTTMTVSVNSDGFCANTDMDIDIKQFVVFVDNLSSLYSTLNGIAIIQEPYGEQQFIKFSGDRTGYIGISGRLTSNNHSNCVQTLSFENSIDQTYISNFAKSLYAICAQYR